MKIDKFSKCSVVLLIALSSVLIACQKKSDTPSTETKAAQPSQAAQSPSDEPLSVEEAHDDLVGNWQLDPRLSKSLGLKNAIGEKSTITMVMEPSGSRTLYRDGQPIEQGELILSEVKSDGKLVGRFNRISKALPLDVNIRVLGETKMEWTFSGGQRVESFKRQVVEPSSDFQD